MQKVYVMTAWGSNLGGPVSLDTVLAPSATPSACSATASCRFRRCDLADTMGWASPEEVRRRIGAVRELAPEAKIGLHLHDTRGLGGAKVYAALSIGVSLFDASVAGHKARQTSGNVCTEDMVFLCHELGIETGIGLEKLIEASRMAEDIIGRPLMGRLMHSGSLRAFRQGKTADSVCVSVP